MDPAWNSFFVAETGAAAALTGLFFVAVSINLRQILQGDSLPGRAAETVLMLTGALLGASLMLVPAASARTLGLLLGLIAAGIWGICTRLHVRAAQSGSEIVSRTLPIRVGLGQAATLPALMAAGFLILDSPTGFAVLAAGILITFAVSLLNSWVLLVEILR
jgi:modulator of FtsH protease